MHNRTGMVEVRDGAVSGLWSRLLLVLYVLSSVCGRVEVALEPRTAWAPMACGPCSRPHLKSFRRDEFFQSSLCSKHAAGSHGTLHAGDNGIPESTLCASPRNASIVAPTKQHYYHHVCAWPHHRLPSVFGFRNQQANRCHRPGLVLPN